MLKAIEDNDNISLFNARKALYIKVDPQFRETIRKYLVGKLNEIKFKDEINKEN